jgi:hypothetical protein
MKNDKFFKIGHLSLLNDHLSFEFGSLRRQKLVNEFASFPNDVSGEFISKNTFSNGARASRPHAGQRPAFHSALHVVLLMNSPET